MAQFQGPILSSEFPGSVAAGFFVNEIWFLSLTPETNVALWSISFEFWYYAIFAVYVFAPRLLKWAGIAIAAAIAGPQILLLMPGWILGAALYHIRAYVRMPRAIAVAIFVAGPALVLAGHAFHLASFLQGLYLPLLGSHVVYGDIFFARDFLWQNLVGLLLAAHLAAAYVLFREAEVVPAATVNVIRWGAGLTYSIYLLHFPAELVLTGRLHAMHEGPFKVVLVMIGATVISAGFGILLEPIKGPLRKWMTRITTPGLKVRASVSAA